jgi:transposase-like protein/Tfp pilus assembly protein PilZ
VFVTLNDISSGGCCILRKGRLDLAIGDAVTVDIWTHDIADKLPLHARVCWASHQEATSRVGLRFVETNHRLLRQIEAYVQHFHRPADASRPQARVPNPARAAVSEPLQPQPSLARATPAAARPRRSGRSAMRAPERHDLASMPRPGRLTSLDLQRRMRPAHRHEVARIAEETGIHIHTLYGWLRTLRLEGEINPERPRDPEAWSATDKFSALLQVSGMSAAERTAYCQRHGIAQDQLQRWREAALQANAKPVLILRAEEELQRLRVRDQRDIRRLQKELRRRERSASISDELLQVVRKLQTLWELEDSP